MDISNETLILWRKLYDRGDAEEIAKRAGVHKNTYFNTINRRKGSPKLLKVIYDFFEEKQKLYQKMP